jgi:predicted enzyme related to lactoylglutathione lyase
MRATVSHFEIPARDPQRAAAFYREVFGWAVTPREWKGRAYFEVRTEEPGKVSSSALTGAIQGGLADRRELGADHPLLVVHVTGAEVAEVLERVAAHGGAVERPARQIAGTASFATFRDPEGNLLGLWVEEG